MLCLRKQLPYHRRKGLYILSDNFPPLPFREHLCINHRTFSRDIVESSCILSLTVSACAAVRFDSVLAIDGQARPHVSLAVKQSRKKREQNSGNRKHLCRTQSRGSHFVFLPRLLFSFFRVTSRIPESAARSPTPGRVAIFLAAL